MKKIFVSLCFLLVSIQQIRTCPPCAAVIAYFAGISTETIVVSGVVAGVATANVVYFTENSGLFRPVTEPWSPHELPNPGGPRGFEWISRDAFLQMLAGTAVLEALTKAPTEFKTRKQYLEKEYDKNSAFHNHIEQLSTQLVKNGYLIIPVPTTLGTASRIIVPTHSWNPEYLAFYQYDEVSATWSHTSYTETGWTVAPTTSTDQLKTYEQLTPKSPGTFAWNRGLQYMETLLFKLKHNTITAPEFMTLKSFAAGLCYDNQGCQSLQTKVTSALSELPDLGDFEKTVANLQEKTTQELIEMLLNEADEHSFLSHAIRTILFRRAFAGESIPTSVFCKGNITLLFVEFRGEMLIILIQDNSTKPIHMGTFYLMDQIMSDDLNRYIASINLKVYDNKDFKLQKGVSHISAKQPGRNPDSGDIEPTVETYEDQAIYTLKKIGLNERGQ